MSRYKTKLSETTTMYAGFDMALGAFLDITDSRFANSGKDEQGEGYILQYSQIFGLGPNLINATVFDLNMDNRAKLMELIETFIKTLKL